MPVPRPGYTLIELVIVIAIIGTLAAIAVPKFASASTRYRVECGAARLARDLEKMREQAITRSLGYELILDDADMVYRFGPVGFPSELQSVDLGGEPYRVRIEVISPVAGELVFDGFGNASHNAEIEVTAGQWTAGVLVRAEGGSVQWSLR
jgi:prepilin-type N-terminal cleavage/methylation domain-containing protein